MILKVASRVLLLSFVALCALAAASCGSVTPTADGGAGAAGNGGGGTGGGGAGGGGAGGNNAHHAVFTLDRKSVV